ncbi:hypothetical protein FHS78_001251 [Parvibaculum indicum]|uniref:autotransporter outer membrane beta-barrel domain-containing protein n=1 Tax=Parvibaculum indicum TaxID=562969 RepID=UPI00141ECEF2|nr:autotransporter outer membrane beta-barrel domain-containing protein [Parvibaculum indicum]NIJ40970.1 hypothetical protein [Parvibaculum indicum]
MKYVHVTRGALMASAAMGLLVTGFAARADATPAPTKTDSSSSVVQDGTGLASAGQIAGFIANHLAGSTGGTGTQTSAAPMTGVAAGGGAAAVGTLWFNAGAMRVDDSHAGANYDGDIYNAVLGYDLALTDSLTLGLAGGYERIRIDTKYNSGTLKGNVWTIAPYLSYRIDDMLSFNATVGRSWADYDVAHSVSATGSTDGKRWFGAANLVAEQNVDAWRLSETLGYFYVSETQDAYTESGVGALTVAESKRHLGQIRVGGKAGYEIPTSFGHVTPYLSARAEFDVNKSSDVVLTSGATVSQDDFGTTFGAGVDGAAGRNVNFRVEATTEAFRKDYDAYGISATVSLKF